MSGGAVKVAREMLNIALVGYGMFNGPGFSLPRARLWVFVDEPTSNFGKLRVAYNNTKGRVEWRDVGTVTSALVSKSRWMFTMDNGQGATLVPAPCACGGGQAAHAGPSDKAHYSAMVRTDQLPWIRTL
jgi:hypothetical protein